MDCKVLVEALQSELMLFDFRGSTRGSTGGGTHHATLGGAHQGTWVEEGKHARKGHFKLTHSLSHTQTKCATLCLFYMLRACALQHVYCRTVRASG
jgi:hypothetical protein